MDKTRTKQLWLGCGVPTPTYARLTATTDFAQVVQELGLPLMVKPTHEGSSIGMRRLNVLKTCNLHMNLPLSMIVTLLPKHGLQDVNIPW